MKSTRIAWPLSAGVVVVGTALGADSSPADKQALLKQQAISVTVEITQTQTSEFGTVAKDSLTDGATHSTKTARFVIPFTMAMPDTCPPGTTSNTEAMEQGRCIGWMVAPPDDAAVEAALTTGKMEMAGNPMYSPVEFSIDEVSQFRYRDTPAQGFATDTTTLKGRGVAYMMRSGMLLCDVKKMACDLDNAFTGYLDAIDLVTVSKTSDISGSEAGKETVGPARLIPTVPKDLAKQLIGFPITLPLPFTKVFSGPVTLKLTLSAKSAGKVPAEAH